MQSRLIQAIMQKGKVNRWSVTWLTLASIILAILAKEDDYGWARLHRFRE